MTRKTITPLDRYGIGAAQFMALELFNSASRDTGKSTQLIASLQVGDAVVVADQRTARLYAGMIRDRGFTVSIGYSSAPVDITVMVIDPASDHRRVMGTNPTGHTHLDHSFVTKVYLEALRKAADRLAVMEDDLSSATFRSRHAHPMNEQVISRYAL